MIEIDTLETRLRAASGLPPVDDCWRHISEERSFIAGLGCYTRVQLDHIDGKPVGGISISLRYLSVDAAEAIIRFLAQRNEPNHHGGYAPGLYQHANCGGCGRPFLGDKWAYVCCECARTK